MKAIDFPLQIGFYGDAKDGKSHLAGEFIKQFGGLVIEPVVIKQLPPKKGQPARYVVDQSKYGHSAYALKNVGLDLNKQYRYVKSWTEYNRAIDELYVMADSSDKRLWLVIDDSDQWRRLYTYHLAIDVNGRTQVTKDEYMQAGGDLVVEMNRLKNMFNIVYINQTKEEYINEIATGNQVPAVYPANAKFIYEVYGKLIKNRSTKTRDFIVESLTIASDIDDDFVSVIPAVTPEKLLTACHVDKDMW